MRTLTIAPRRGKAPRREVAIYSGPTLIGFIARIGQEFEAFTGEGDPLGRFGTSGAALDELRLAHRLTRIDAMHGGRTDGHHRPIRSA
jgi:hypothetical protein